MVYLVDGNNQIVAEVFKPLPSSTNSAVQIKSVNYYSDKLASLTVQSTATLALIASMVYSSI